jgi:hypothetical protein
MGPPAGEPIYRRRGSAAIAWIRSYRGSKLDIVQALTPLSLPEFWMAATRGGKPLSMKL